MYELRAKTGDCPVNTLPNLTFEQFEARCAKLIAQKHELRKVKRLRIWAKDPQGVIWLLWNS